jgi:hypothetical protein
MQSGNLGKQVLNLYCALSQLPSRYPTLGRIGCLEERTTAVPLHRFDFATSVNIYVMGRKVTEHPDHKALASNSTRAGDFALRSGDAKSP